MADRVETYTVKLDAKDDASKVVDKLDDKVTDLTKKPHETELTADASQAETTANKLQGDIKAILDQARKPVALELDTSDAEKGLGRVEGKAGGLKESVVNDARDLTGVFGGLSGPIGDFGDAFVGAANVAGPALAKIGVSVESLIGPLAVGGIAFGAVKYFWDNFVGGADQAKGKLLEVQTAMAAGEFTKAAAGIVDALKPWRTTMDDLGVSVKTATDFVTGLTDTLPLSADKVADHTSKEFFLTQELQRQRQAWSDNHADLLQQQTDQFNALRAIGGTTEAMLAQASTALPELRASILKYVAAQEGIPDEKITTILTDADPDDVKQVEDELNRVARDRAAVVDVSANTAAAEHAINSLVDEISRKQARLTIGANAMAGTPYAAGGFYRVGEAGPETVFLPRGSRVDTAGRTMMADLHGAGTVQNFYNITVTVPVGAPTAEVGRYVTDAIDLHERRSGRRRRAVS